MAEIKFKKLIKLCDDLVGATFLCPGKWRLPGDKLESDVLFTDMMRFAPNTGTINAVLVNRGFDYALRVRTWDPIKHWYGTRDKLCYEVMWRYDPHTKEENFCPSDTLRIATFWKSMQEQFDKLRDEYTERKAKEDALIEEATS